MNKYRVSLKVSLGTCQVLSFQDALWLTRTEHFL